MTLQIRAATAADAPELRGTRGHRRCPYFPHDFPSVEVATGALSGMIAHPGFFGVVADEDGRILGSNFLDERSIIPGVGPITVDPDVQNRRVGLALMNAVLERSAQQRAPGMRLLQSAYHNRSMSLYAKLGFDVRESFAVMQGKPLGLKVSGYAIRAATEADVEGCDALCVGVHGHDRGAKSVTRWRREQQAWSSGTAGSRATPQGWRSLRIRSARQTTISRL
jgi:GNAT superfamily N-acetyltransferase